MATVRITGPDGRTIKLTAPDGATEDVIAAKVEEVKANWGQYVGGEAREKTGMMNALREGLLQGLTFGFADEIEGAAKGAYDALTSDKSYSDAYAERVKAARDRVDAAKADAPFSFYAGEIGGGVAVPFGVGKVAAQTGIRALTPLANAADKGLRAKTVAAAKEGAAYGAAYGAGTSEGGIEDRAAGAGAGAVAGGLIGGALPGAIEGAAALGKRVALPFRGYFNPEGVAAQKYAEAAARDAGWSGDAAGIQQGLDVTNARAARAARIDPGQARVMDVGGEATKGLLRQAYDMPNDMSQSVKRMLDARQGRQWRDVEASLAKTTGTAGKNLFGTIDDTIAQRERQASPAFKAAFEAPFNVTPDSDLARFLSERTYMRRLVEKANENIAGMTGKSADDVMRVLKVKEPAADDLAEIAKIRQSVGKVDKATAETLYDQFKYYQSMRQQAQPERLVSFIVRTGGIADDGREIRHMVGRPKDRPGLVNQRGSSLDDAALRAWEQGYFPNHTERPSVREFLDALDDDLRGNAVYRAADYATLESKAVADQMGEELARFGISPRAKDANVREALGIPPERGAIHTGPEGSVKPWEFLHRVKMEIDRELGRLKRGQQDAVANWTKADLTRLKNEFKGLIDKHNPQYGKALAQYEGDSALLNAAQDGFDEAFDQAIPHEQLTKALREMSPSEREMYRLGAARALAGKIEQGKKNRNLPDAIFSTPDMQRRMLAIWPDQASHLEFRRLLEAKRDQSEVRAALQGGSKTSKNLTQADEAGAPVRAVQTAAALARGRLEPALAALERVGNRFSGLTPATANALLQIGARPAAQGLPDDVMRAIEQAARSPEERAEILRLLLGGVGAGSGEAAGRD